MNSSIVLTEGNSKLTMVPQLGGKILELILDGVTVIKADEGPEHLGSGSYLMFPWVNRLSKDEV